MRIKQIMAGVLCICLLACTLSMATGKKALAEAPFTGDFVDGSGEVHLRISKSGNKYNAVYEHLRLCMMDDLKGTVKKGVLTLKGLDPAGKPITLTVSRKGKKRVLKFKKTTWQYFTQGKKVILKISANP
ncbi:hypothetical protein D7V86_12720 [bacterium D16-51]|nr:hypothetical protein D7V96_14485 [bacterium D16-59]RKI59542.1 hypothetical protein D7V86_12720 [bacterium D16-51]